MAQNWVADGHIRLNGRRVERPSADVKCGDVLVLPLPTRVSVIKVLSLPERRGPALEAQGCYRVLDDLGETPLARPYTDTEGRNSP